MDACPIFSGTVRSNLFETLLLSLFCSYTVFVILQMALSFSTCMHKVKRSRTKFQKISLLELVSARIYRIRSLRNVAGRRVATFRYNVVDVHSRVVMDISTPLDKTTTLSGNFGKEISGFLCLLTVHLGIILDNDQLDTHLIYFTVRLL